jgi:YVTN family beta-propeller protein
MLTVLLAVAVLIGAAAADWATVTVPVGPFPSSIALNPVTNRIYVGSETGDLIKVIDGATNDTATVIVGNKPMAAAVNPVTNRLYVANGTGNEVLVVQDNPARDTKVRLEYGRLPDDTTVFPRPALTGKAVNRWLPGRTMMMGVGNRANTAQMSWDWANVTSGAGTDSIT